MNVSGVIKILGGEKIVRKRVRNRLDLIELSNRGLTKSALSHLADCLSIPLSRMAELLPVSGRTIQRQALQDHFSPLVSEQILQIAEVTAKGIEVFEDKDKFRAWLNHPNRALADKTPMSLINSRFGAEMVMNELGRIEHGVIS